MSNDSERKSDNATAKEAIAVASGPAGIAVGAAATALLPIGAPAVACLAVTAAGTVGTMAAVSALLGEVDE